jgi:hypothetical protein
MPDSQFATFLLRRQSMPPTHATKRATPPSVGPKGLKVKAQGNALGTAITTAQP